MSSRPGAAGGASVGDAETTLDTPSAPGGSSSGATALAADAFLSPGVVVNGRYRVDRLLARGGMGGVYRVDDQLFPGRPTALKIFLRPREETVKLFRAEFRTMASLRHPNVARVYDFEQVAGVDAFFFTMELLPGVPLDRLLAFPSASEDETLDSGAATAREAVSPPASRSAPGRVVPWEETLDLLVPVIRALAYLHGRGVVHFDLKPGNIVVGARGAARQVKVVDFGLAGLRGMRGLSMGTPQYVSPEIASGRGGDHRSDLYSLGIMAFKLLTGDVPYASSKTLDALLKQKLTEPVRFSPAQKERVPAWLCDVVERACSVDPAARPSSAGELLELVNRGGGLAFELETRDTRENYLFSSAFVGRAREMEDVSRAVDAGLRGERHTGLFVTGTSGMGKSRLMREVRHAVQLRGVPFLEVDCFERDLTDSGPMANLVLQAARLAVSVGAGALLDAHAPEMVKLVPSLPLGPGVAPTPPLPNADAERRRVLEAIAAFLVELGRAVPYLAYVNDLQWARDGTIDAASALLALRSTDSAESTETSVPSRLCLLGSYRAGEVSGRPVARLVQPGPERPSPRVVELSPLRDEDVAGLLKSMLGLAELPDGLAARVAASSEGLPFFVEEILRDLLEEGRLSTADGGGIDAAASFLRRAARVSADERRLLDILAVSGRPVDTDVLVDVSGLPRPAARAALEILGEKQMVVPVPGERERYNLAHDRMREALYAALARDDQTARHLRLARSLAAALEKDGRWETLFEAVAHFGQALDRDGPAALDGEAEKTRVARLLHRAAVATNATGAFAAGVSYLERARTLLPERPFEREYALALDVDHALAATLIPLGRFDEALAAADRIVANAKGPLDESPGWEARILAYSALNEYARAIAAGIEICGRLGLALPPDPTRLDIARILGRVLWKVRTMTDETLATLPEVADPRALRLIRIMSSMTACAYVSRPYLWPVLIGNCLTLMLRHGKGPTHALLFVWFATALNAVGLYGASLRFARLGVRLMGAPDGAAFLPKLHQAMGQFVSHWREPLARSVDWCGEGYALGRRVEDAEFACYCHMGWAKARFETGEPLADVRAASLAALDTMRAFGQLGTEVMHKSTIEAVEALMGLAPAPAAGYAPGPADLSNTQNAFRLLDRARLLCFFRTSDGPALGRELLAVSDVGLPATFFLSIAHYFACLGWLMDARRSGAWTAFGCLWRVSRARGRIRRWARLCPHNFEHRALLVDAEWLRSTGRAGRSLRLYEEAIAAAVDHGFLQDAGLAHELAAEMLLDRGDTRAARVHLLAARERYRAWGADAKVLDLEARHAALLGAA
jgi:predicted ATPase